MSERFPHIDLEALKKFAAAAAAAEHAYRASLKPAPDAAANIGKGKGRAAAYPRVARCVDTAWAGEWMIFIEIERESAPLGPHTMLAHFPRGRPGYTTKAAVGMAQVAREHARVRAPKVFGYYDNAANPVGAECVLLEHAPGESLEAAWPGLSGAQRDAVCDALADVLVRLFDCRGPAIETYTHVRDSPPRPPAEAARLRAPVLLARAFDMGPLARLPPQEALGSAHDYLIALSARVERVFGEPALGAAARRTGWPRTPPLSDADVLLARDTWTRLGSLVLYHSGGYYVPRGLSPAARQAAFGVLQAKDFGVVHADLRMGRILLYWAGAEARLVLTGWEHAHRAPLWSCARMPPWLRGAPGPEALSWAAQRAARARVFGAAAQRSWSWAVAHVFGATERWFEGVLGAGWAWRDAAEVCLVRLAEHWARAGPGVPFPLEVGGPYLRARMFAQPPLELTLEVEPEPAAEGEGGEEDGDEDEWEDELQATDPDVLEAAMQSWEALDGGVAGGAGGEVPHERTRKFVEEVRVAMNALAIGGGSKGAARAAWPDAMNQVD